METKVTKCACGRDIYYKTKAPKKCDVCKKASKKGYKPKLHGSSEGELTMFYTLNELLHVDYVNNGYYSWLPSPKGVPMQIDRYYPDIKLGFEYDGRQHYEYNRYFHKSKKQFKYLQECDALKSKLCADRGVTLIRLRYDKKITKEYILLKIRETNPRLYEVLKGNKLLSTLDN